LLEVSAVAIRIGLKTYWPTGVAYHQFATQDLLASVHSVLKRYERWSLT
jgi:hypothetical protein